MHANPAPFKPTPHHAAKPAAARDLFGRRPSPYRRFQSARVVDMPSRQYVASKSGKERRGFQTSRRGVLWRAQIDAAHRTPQAPGTSARKKGSKMPLITKRGLTLALMATCLAAAPAAAAKKKPAPAPAAPADSGAAPAPGGAPGGAPQSNVLALVPTQKDWTKVCGKDQTASKDVCYTTRDFSALRDRPAPGARAWPSTTSRATTYQDHPHADADRPDAAPRFPLLAVDKRPEHRRRLRDLLSERLFRRGQGQDAVPTDSMKKATRSSTSACATRPRTSRSTFTVPLAGFGKAYRRGADRSQGAAQEQQQQAAGGACRSSAEDERKKPGSTDPRGQPDRRRQRGRTGSQVGGPPSFR